MSSSDVMVLVSQIEPAVAGFTMSVQSVNAVIDQVAAAAGLTDKKDDFLIFFNYLVFLFDQTYNCRCLFIK